jgi:hypothetical protein
MIALFAVILVLVQIESRGVESERLWKGPVLVRLFCEVYDEIMKQVQLVRKSDIRDVASSTSFSLDLDAKTLRLVARYCSWSPL